MGNKKKIFVGTILAGLLSITGCMASKGGVIGGYEDIDNYTANETGELKFDSDGHVIFDDVKIKLFTICAGLDRYGLEDVVDQFNKEYSGEIEVQTEIEGQGSYETSIVTRITTGIGVPEIMMFHNENLPTLQRNHLFQPVDRIATMANIDLKADQFAEGVRQNGIVGDKLFGVTIDSHSEVVLARKDLLDKYNLAVPTSYPELINAAKKIQDGEREEGIENFKGISMSTQAFGIYQYSFYTAILQNGGTLLSESDARPNWDAPDNIDAVETAVKEFRDLFWGDNAVSKYGETETQPDTDFSTGKCAFSFNYTWELDNVFRTFDKRFDEEDRLLLPLSGLLAQDASKPYSQKIYGVSHGFYMPYTISDVVKKAAAVEFMKYFSEHSVKWNNWGHVSMNINYSNSDEYLNEEETQEKTLHIGKTENFVNFPFNYFLTCATGALDNLFTFCCNNPNSDIRAKIAEYCDLANKTINMLI